MAGAGLIGLLIHSLQLSVSAQAETLSTCVSLSAWPPCVLFPHFGVCSSLNSSTEGQRERITQLLDS